MRNPFKQQNGIPWWLHAAALVSLVAGLTIIAYLETQHERSSPWLTTGLFVLVYIALQFLCEGILSVYFESKPWVAKLFTVTVLLVFYLGVYFFFGKSST